jgi:predicted ATPase
MLTAIEIESFKCFQKLALPLRPLTLLSGRNASGKSTVLQALVLLHQTAVEAEWSTELRLNGALVKLGTAGDVIDKVTGRRTVGLALATASTRCEWLFEILDRRTMSIPVKSARRMDEGGRIATYELDTASASSELHFLLPRASHPDAHEPAALETILANIQYISAERLGPREIYPLTDASRTDVGALGENAPALLYWYGDNLVEGPLVLESTPPTLRRQVEAWMREFFPGCGLDVQPVPNANQVSLGLRTSDATTYHRPQHIGFGLTHVLPIITAALCADASNVLLIENPEVHLHPAGQSLMGQFLARVAAAGVQVLLETHSDHVLNGVRRAVRDSMLAPEDVAIHFFQERERAIAEGLSQVVSPQIDGEGNIDHWPEGFFDQLDKDMSYFAGWGG